MPYKDPEIRRIKANEYTKKWREINRERYLALHRAQMNGYWEKNKERLQRKNRAYYEGNKEKFIAANKRRMALKRDEVLEKLRIAPKEHYAKNKERYAERGKRRRAEHPEVMRQYVAARRAKKIACGGKYTTVDIERLKKAQRGRCYWCSTSYGRYEVDHVVPISRGGSNGPENIVLSCRTCNRSKGAKMPYAMGKLL